MTSFGWVIATFLAVGLFVFAWANGNLMGERDFLKREWRSSQADTKQLVLERAQCEARKGRR